MTKVQTNDYVDASGAARCVDERGDKEGELLGVQMPGGSQHIMDLFALSLDSASDEFTDQLLFELTSKVYSSTVADEYDFEPGMHIDDEHGHLDMKACSDRDAGCGYDKVRTQVLERMGVNLEYSPGERIKTARTLGWNVQVLTQDHVATATAAINSIENKTLKTQDLLSEDRNQSFNYDHWVVKILTPIMAKILCDEEHDDAASALVENAQGWGKQLYVETLDILSGGALGEDSLIEISA